MCCLHSDSRFSYVPISTQRNITCSLEGGTLSQFVVTFSNKDSITYTTLLGTEFVTGIVVISADLTRFLISININDTCVTGIRCEGNLRTGSSSTPDAYTLHLGGSIPFFWKKKNCFQYIFKKISNTFCHTSQNLKTVT